MGQLTRFGPPAPSRWARGRRTDLVHGRVDDVQGDRGDHGGDLCLIETTAPIGHGPPLHVHHDEHEAFYVIEGELEIFCGGELHVAAAVEFAFPTAPDRPHVSGRSTTRPSSNFLTITVPGRPESTSAASADPRRAWSTARICN